MKTKIEKPKWKLKIILKSLEMHWNTYASLLFDLRFPGQWEDRHNPFTMKITFKVKMVGFANITLAGDGNSKSASLVRHSLV